MKIQSTFVRGQQAQLSTYWSCNGHAKEEK